jgi:hypothetical protein
MLKRKFNSAPMCICSLCQKIIFLSVKKFKRKISHVCQVNAFYLKRILNLCISIMQYVLCIVFAVNSEI